MGSLSGKSEEPDGESKKGQEKERTDNNGAPFHLGSRGELLLDGHRAGSLPFGGASCSAYERVPHWRGGVCVEPSSNENGARLATK